ncbi:MAG TPA: ABC transporter ATP-binding protein [Chloroflexota bacterium]|nr:ABC transporter ATP-binding protein [Chloroflexota bacterium]
MMDLPGGWRSGPGLHDIPDEVGAAYNPRVTRRAMTYIKPYRKQVILAVIVTIAAGLMNMIGPYLVKIAIDSDIVAQRNLPGLTVVIALTLGVYRAYFLFTAKQTLIVSEMGQKILRTMRQQMFEHLQRLPLTYYDKHPTGVIVSRLVNDVSVMNDLLTNGLLTLLGDVMTLVGTLVMMAILSPRLALVTFATLPIMGIAIWVFTQKAKIAYRLTREKIGAVAADFQESIDGMRVVQAFARERTSQDQFDVINDENRWAFIRANGLSSALMPVVEFDSALATIAVIAYGGYLAIQGQVTIGVIVAFLAYITRFFAPIRTLTQFYNQLQAATAGAEKVFELMDEPVTIAESPRAITLERVRGEVEFRDVSFSYGREAVLQDVSFHADPGEMVAMVGHTGAGKTTVASLLSRFYDPVEGTVLLDGCDLCDLSFETLRRSVALVLQDNFLFAGSIRENIRYGRPDATNEEIEAAAQAANAEEFILRTSQGYETLVMERAANLSLGQRQLIAIARAVLADPRVLILDEATSNIDSRTEQLVQEALHKLLAGRTSLVIAHRLSTIRAADQVLVLDGGQIIERGRHEELLRRRGFYYRLHQQQFAEIEPAAA